MSRASRIISRGRSFCTGVIGSDVPLATLRFLETGPSSTMPLAPCEER